MTSDPVEVLVVGAGPTGLVMAAQLAAYGVRPRLIDRATDRVHESRAMAIQPRTLEVLAGLGVTQELVAQGNQAVRLCMHARGDEVSVPLFDLGMTDTAYPYLLFLSQARTERILSEHLAGAGLAVERGVELTQLRPARDAVTAGLRHADGRMEQVQARYVVGCDGAHSTVRAAVGIGFEGGSYPQTFVLADVEADGLAADAAHAFLSERGMLLVFPLRRPASWRLVAMRPVNDPTPGDAPVTLDEVQDLVDGYTDSTVRLHDPVWMSNFRLHHRAAERYRSGRIFLAGDAAHIHSPAGAQGMNTGIQDAVNLAWKLAQTLRGQVAPAVLDTYHQERAPIGRRVLRLTDRAFTVATSTNPVIGFARTRIAPAVLPLVMRSEAGRSYAWRSVAQLSIAYRASALSLDGPLAPRHGPRAGDRLPDSPIVHNGRPSSLHASLASPGWHLLVCGPDEAWPPGELAAVISRYADRITVHRLDSDGLRDPTGQLQRQLGVDAAHIALYLVRPDGHVGYRCGPRYLAGLRGYLRRWLPTAPHDPGVPHDHSAPSG